MLHYVVRLFLGLFVFVSIAWGQHDALSPAEAIHLVEYQLKRLNAGAFQASEVSHQDSLCIVKGDNWGQSLYATIDAARARVLELRRNNSVFYRWPGIQVVGHRGTVKFAPENTIPAIKAAIDLGVDLIEIDIRETKDGELVLMHDETVNRTTNGSGNLSDMTLDEVKQLDAGSWFSDKFTGTRVPTLREALAAMRGKALPDLDFKAGTPRHLIEIVEEEELLGKVTLYCGDWDLLQRTQALAPDGFLLRPTVPGGKPGLPIVLDRFDPAVVNINWEQFSEPLVREVHLAGKRSFLNTMQKDTEFTMQLMLQTLPDYLQSDHIEILLPMLREHGLHD